MLFSERSIWTMVHGVGLGGAALLGLAAASFYLYAVKPGSSSSEPCVVASVGLPGRSPPSALTCGSRDALICGLATAIVRAPHGSVARAGTVSQL